MQHCNLKGVDLLFNITLLTQKWTLLLHSSFWNMFETYNLWSCPKIYELFSWCNGQDVPFLNPKEMKSAFCCHSVCVMALDAICDQSRESLYLSYECVCVRAYGWHCVLCKINWNLHITNLQTHIILN